MKAWRYAAALLSVAVALATAYAVLSNSMVKGMGFTIIDAVVAPVALVFYLGPALLTWGMASRSRSAAAVAVAVVIALLLAGGLEVLRATPWHFRPWRGSSDAETTLLFGVLLGFWPLTAIGGLTWLVLNRRSSVPRV